MADYRLVRLISLVTLIVAVAVGALMMVAVGTTYRCGGCDYLTFSAIGPKLMSGDPIYQPWQMGPYRLIEAARGQGWVYPPTAAVLMAPVQWVPELAWRMVNVGSMIVVVWLMLREHVRDASLLAAVVVLIFPPTWIAWANGQVTPLLAAGFGVAYLYPRWTWAIAAVGTAIKLFPLVLLAWALRERGWRDVALGIGALAVVVTVTLPLVGVASWPVFVEAWTNGQPNCDYAPLDSIQCNFGAEAQMVAYVLAGLLALAALLVRRRSVAFLMLTFAPVVATPDVNRPYWLVPLIGGVAVAADLIRKRQLEPLRLDA